MSDSESVPGTHGHTAASLALARLMSSLAHRLNLAGVSPGTTLDVATAVRTCGLDEVRGLGPEVIIGPRDAGDMICQALTELDDHARHHGAEHGAVTSWSALRTIAVLQQVSLTGSATTNVPTAGSPGGD